MLGVDNVTILHFARTVIVGLLFLAGYMFGGLWVYKRFFAGRSPAQRQTVAGLGILLGLVLTVGSSYLAIPGTPDVRMQLRATSDAWRMELLALATNTGG